VLWILFGIQKRKNNKHQHGVCTETQFFWSQKVYCQHIYAILNEMILREYMQTWTALIIKQAAALTTVSAINYFLVYFLGVPSDFIQNAWGVACCLVFTDAMILYHDFKLLESKKIDVDERFKLLQSMFQHIHSTQVLTLDNNTKQISSLDSKLDKLTKEIRSSCNSFSSSFGDMDVTVAPAASNHVQFCTSSSSDSEPNSSTTETDDAKLSATSPFFFGVQKARHALVKARSLNVACSESKSLPRNRTKSVSPPFQARTTKSNPESLYDYVPEVRDQQKRISVTLNEISAHPKTHNDSGET